MKAGSVMRTQRQSRASNPPAVQGNAIDSRYHPSAAVRRQLNKVFPTHWSFLLGEIALYSFIILLLTGVFLTVWFKPSMAEIEYQGTYQLMRGLSMSEAFASTLTLSFDIRGGLLVRQIHHWAAMLFVASMTVHMLRIFFTGAFRKPRELNWLIGVGQQKSRIASNGLVIAGPEPLRLALLVGQRPHKGLNLLQLQ